MAFRATEASLSDAVEEARSWLWSALDLWSIAGVDREHGGFHDRLGQDVVAEDRPKRCRVQARQVYSFIAAGRLGWAGPWKDIARAGLRFMLDHYAMPDGSFRLSVSRDGSSTGAGDVDNYDQAFAMFALAHARSSWPERELDDAAHRCLAFLATTRGHSAGGFLEAGDRAGDLLANPHMHLLECALEWRSLGSRRFEELGRTIVRLAETRFIDGESGGLREVFDRDWLIPADSDGGIEPGHQFEWAWLLDRWDPSSPALAGLISGLYRMGARGVDERRHVAVAELRQDGSVKDGSTRLWPQTERMKAALTMARRTYGAQRRGYEQDAADAWTGLKSFFDVPVRGLWLDRLHADGSFEQEGAPASSLYHIVCGLSELFRYTNDDVASRRFG